MKRKGNREIESEWRRMQRMMASRGEEEADVARCLLMKWSGLTPVLVCWEAGLCR